MATPVMAPNGAPIYRIERGGEVTFHGPGQLVCYPLFDLKRQPFQPDLHWYLRQIEEVILEILREFRIHGGRDAINTGMICKSFVLLLLCACLTHRPLPVKEYGSNRKKLRLLGSQHPSGSPRMDLHSMCPLTLNILTHPAYYRVALTDVVLLACRNSFNRLTLLSLLFKKWDTLHWPSWRKSLAFPVFPRS
mmetsp:Transcript_23217/g.53894  ORF Transcript_23217/g.53894 Transcript_23217/m.53894 type:complete len:192 (+) Transcript_23217:780-1355(+)